VFTQVADVDSAATTASRYEHRAIYNYSVQYRCLYSSFGGDLVLSAYTLHITRISVEQFRVNVLLSTRHKHHLFDVFELTGVL